MLGTKAVSYTHLVNVIHCKNPRCITSIEQELPHIFYLADEKSETYRCQYCEEKYSEYKEISQWVKKHTAGTRPRCVFVCEAIGCGLFGGHDLDPVAVRIGDKIDAHGGILKADAAHGLMVAVNRLIVVHVERQVEDVYKRQVPIIYAFF